MAKVPFREGLEHHLVRQRAWHSCSPFPLFLNGRNRASHTASRSKRSIVGEGQAQLLNCREKSFQGVSRISKLAVQSPLAFLY